MLHYKHFLRNKDLNVEVSTVFVILALLGGKLFPIVVGNLVETWPIMLHYLSLALSAACLLIFSLANIIYRYGGEGGLGQDDNNKAIIVHRVAAAQNKILYKYKYNYKINTILIKSYLQNKSNSSENPF